MVGMMAFWKVLTLAGPSVEMTVLIQDESSDMTLAALTNANLVALWA